MSVSDKRWLSVEEAAEHTGTDPDWILAHIKSGALRCVITANRAKATGPGKYRRRIDRLKLDALMERLEEAGVETVKAGQAEPAMARPVKASGGETAKERRARRKG